MEFFSNLPDEVLKEVGSSEKGLTSAEASERLAKNGANMLAAAKKKTMLQKLLLQFKDIMVIILLVAALISGIMAIVEHTPADLFEGGIILAIVIMNAVVGLIQENKAEQALDALNKLSKPFSKVLRDGEMARIKTEDLVVGDIIILEAGDSIPADMRLLESASLKIEESALTGESVASDKFTNLVPSGAPLGDRDNMAYMGSNVTYGRGKGVIVAAGMHTEMGSIAQMLNAETTQDTPIQKKLASTGKIISIAVLGIALVVFIINMIRGGTEHIADSFMTAVALAVAAIPEGLPTVVTIVMAIGVQTMSKRKAIIRRLPAVETLGSTQVICSDKTGTLTQNVMTVLKTSTLNADFEGKDVSQSKDFSELIRCMMLANDTISRYDGEKFVTQGDSTETCLTVYGEKLGYNHESLDKECVRINEVPFDSERKRMSVVVNELNNQIAYTKGGIDEVLKVCTQVYDGEKVRALTTADIAIFKEKAHKMSATALRVLAMATKPYSGGEIEENLIFIGLVGMIDPPRAEAKEAVKVCKKAGMITVMITGDHRDTATAIAKELGMIKSESEVITGAELDLISDDDFFKTIEKYHVYARVSPSHKVRIVNTWKKRGKIVAMTGDGVNDAPSIKAADIGIGMGITGTDVTKNVADMVLADDNFATIVVAVEEGRKIFSNILKTLQFLLSANVSEVIAIFVTTLILSKNAVFFPAILILWLNLITDSLPALALGMEKAEHNIMDVPPRENKGSLFRGEIGFNLIYQGIAQAAIVLAVFFLSYNVLFVGDNLVASSMAFICMIVMQMCHTLNCKSIRGSMFGCSSNKFLWGAIAISSVLSLAIVYIPGVNTVFGLTFLTGKELLISLAFGLLIIPIVELVKVFTRAYYRKKQRNTAPRV